MVVKHLHGCKLAVSQRETQVWPKVSDPHEASVSIEWRDSGRKIRSRPSLAVEANVQTFKQISVCCCLNIYIMSMRGIQQVTIKS